MPVIDRDQLERRFAHHPPSTPHVADLHGELRQRCLELAEWLNATLPPSDEADRAIDLLDDVCMHGNAAIARHANPPTGKPCEPVACPPAQPAHLAVAADSTADQTRQRSRFFHGGPYDEETP